MSDVNESREAHLVTTALEFPELRSCQANGVCKRGQREAQRLTAQPNTQPQRNVKRVWRTVLSATCRHIRPLCHTVIR